MKPTFRCASGALAIALCASAQLASAANGLDPTFGDDGLTEFVLGDVRATNLVKSMVTADDGVVTMCGALGLELADRKAAILRVLANGSQDPGFGPQHGWVVLPGTVGCDDLALQSTGNVIALIHTDSGYHLNRILANGSIDPQFGVQGVTQLWPDIARPKAVGVLGNGDIVVAGLNVDWQDGNSDFRVRRYTANGAPVPGFGSGGNADLAFDQGSSNDDVVTDLVVDASDRIIVVGEVARSIAGDTDFGVAAFTAAGVLDASFGALGKRMIHFDLAAAAADDRDSATAVSIGGDGRIAVAGTANVSESEHGAAVAVLLGNGSDDSSFSSDAKAAVDFVGSFGDDESSTPRGVGFDSEGRLYVAGRANQSGENDAVAIVRFNVLGALDPQFHGDGIALPLQDYPGNFLEYGHSAQAMAMQGDAPVLGIELGWYSSTDFVIARIEPDLVFRDGYE